MTKLVRWLVTAVAALVLVLTGSLGTRSAEAGSGYFDYGIHTGYINLMEDTGPLADTDSGVSFGFKRGLYFIKDALAVAIDYIGFDAQLLGDDMDDWVISLPTAGLGVGTGFDSFMVYVGGSLSLFGLDAIQDDVHFSVLNPRAVGGLQVGIWNLTLRGEFQLGRAIRLGENVPDYTYTNISFTLGYGFYSDYL